MKKYKAEIIVLVIVLLIAVGVGVYVYLTKKRTPKVVNGVPTGITVDALGNVYDAQNVKIGTDNGDDSYTTTAGVVMDYNGNVLSTPSTTGGTATIPVVGAPITAPVSAPVAVSDSTAVITPVNADLLSNAVYSSK